MYLRRVTRYLSIGMLTAIALTANAATTESDRSLGKRGGFMVQGDLDLGGDDLATVSFVDGSSQDIAAGQGIVVSGGGYFRPITTSPFELQGLVGFKYVTTKASNADINVSRIVWQLLGIYRFENGWYAGGGLVQHTSTSLDGDGFFEDVDFDDATGFDAEFGWRWVGLHYTSIEYENDVIKNVDASNVGVRLSYRF